MHRSINYLEEAIGIALAFYHIILIIRYLCVFISVLPIIGFFMNLLKKRSKIDSFSMRNNKKGKVDHDDQR